MAILGWPHRWHPLREMARLQNELEHALSGWRGQGRRAMQREEFPPVNVYSREENMVVTFELPGMNQEDIDLTVTGATVAVKGERKPDANAEAARYHRRERRAGDFVRAIQLPEEVDGERAAATYKDGVLTVVLPRSAATQPRQIQVQ